MERYRLNIVPDSAPDADGRWIVVEKEEGPQSGSRFWRDAETWFASDIPAGEHLVRYEPIRGSSMSDYSSTAETLAARIEALIPSKPEIMTLTSPWDLFKIGGLKRDDIEPSLGQASAALREAQRRYRNKPTKPQVPLSAPSTPIGRDLILD